MPFDWLTPWHDPPQLFEQVVEGDRARQASLTQALACYLGAGSLEPNDGRNTGGFPTQCDHKQVHEFLEIRDPGEDIDAHTGEGWIGLQLAQHGDQPLGTPLETARPDIAKVDRPETGV